MNPFAGNTPLYGYVAHQDALQRRKKALENEIHAIEEQRRRKLKQSRRDAIMKQAQHIGSLVRQLQETKPEVVRPGVDSTQEKETPNATLHWMFATILQQNDELHSILKNKATSTTSVPTTSSTMRHKQDKPLKLDETRESANSSELDPVETRTLLIRDITPTPSVEKPRAPTTPWDVVENLPQVEWTDHDEEMLEKLLSGDADESQFLPLPGVPSELVNDDGESSDADVNALLQKKKQQQEERIESRRKLSLLFEASSLAKSTGIRRPRWRIDQDKENGMVKPFDDDVAASELPMSPRQVFRSGIVAVLTIVELQRLLRDRRLRERDKSMQDLDAMLNVYFDATRVWLAKLVKTPLLSILQDSSLDVDVSIKTGIFQGSKGFTKWLGRQKATVAPGNDKNASGTEHAKLVKLKVRVKGVVDAIVKAIERSDIPQGILEFWKRLTREGVYFPSTYPLFPTERAALNLDTLGATRETTSVASSGHPRFQIMLVNFFLVRILIHHVVMTPWTVGLGVGTGGSASKQKAISKNLQNVATVLYAIASKLSPLPPVVRSENGLSLRLGMRRRSVDVEPTQPNNQTENTLQSQNAKDGVEADTKRFGSIDDLHATLMPDKLFPLDSLAPFIDEQQRRLRDVCSALQVKLHPPPHHDDNNLFPF